MLEIFVTALASLLIVLFFQARVAARETRRSDKDPRRKLGW